MVKTKSKVVANNATVRVMERSGQKVKPTKVQGVSKPQRGKPSSRDKDLQKIAAKLDAGSMALDSGCLSVLRNEKVTPSVNGQGWYCKYLDPAGAVESHRAVGEHSKIPDGLTEFSVDAEIRVLEALSRPGASEGEILEEGDASKVWSLFMLSYPLFRIGAIIVANLNNEDLIGDVLKALSEALNSIIDLKQVVDRGYNGFFNDSWFFKVVPLPPTFDLPDPVGGEERTVTSWRLTYKSLTVETNAPSLLDQGYWAAGHYALDDSPVAEPTTELRFVPSVMQIQNPVRIINPPNSIYARISIPNLPQIKEEDFSVDVGLPISKITDADYFQFDFGGVVPAEVVTVILPQAQTWYITPSNKFADPGDEIEFSGIVNPADSTLVLTVRNVITDEFFNFQFTFNTQTFNKKLFLNLDAESEKGGTAKMIEFPALSFRQIAANNVKMAQMQLRASDGAYLVHKKMRNPVFQLTPAQSFGPIQFTTPGADPDPIGSGLGIRDTIDRNFSTASLCFRGISWANVPILKIYQGWEGITNVNTPFGQFGHSGLPKEEELLELADQINTETTGVYAANDNFAASVSGFAMGVLSNFLKSETSQSMIRSLAQKATNKFADMIVSR